MYDKIKNNIPHMEQVMLLSELENVQDSAAELKYALEYLIKNSTIEAYRPLGSNKKIIGPILVFFRKILRRMFKFYVEPITTDISNYNLHLLHVIELLIQAINDRDKEIKRLQLEINKD